MRKKKHYFGKRHTYHEPWRQLRVFRNSRPVVHEHGFFSIDFGNLPEISGLYYDHDGPLRYLDIGCKGQPTRTHDTFPLIVRPEHVPVPNAGAYDREELIIGGHRYYAYRPKPGT